MSQITDKNELVDLLLLKSSIGVKPCILTLGFTDGVVDKTILNLVPFTAQELSELGVSFDKAAKVALYAGSAVYTVGVAASNTEEERRFNIAAAIDIVVSVYSAYLTKQSAIYGNALDKVVPFINVASAL